MKALKILFLYTLLAVTGCESLITDIPADKLPSTESKLVVQSFISPQASQILVSVTESTPLFGQSTNSGGTITNATVKISDGTREITLSYNTVNQLYAIDYDKMPIVAGKSYSLHVSDGKRIATGTCKVPLNQATVRSYEIDSVYSFNGMERDTTLTVKMTWQDIPVDTNYYRIKAYLDLEYSVPEGTTAETFQERRVKNRFNIRWDRTFGRNDLQSDASLDGEIFTSPTGRVTLPGSIVYDYGEGKRFVVYPKAKIISITFEVDNTDNDYFKYHRSLELTDTENPFSEPALIYNNITGGLGCFAAYNTGKLVYKP